MEYCITFVIIFSPLALLWTSQASLLKGCSAGLSLQGWLLASREGEAKTRNETPLSLLELLQRIRQTSP